MRTEVSEEHGASFFKVELKMETAPFSETLKYTLKIKQRQNPEDTDCVLTDFKAWNVINFMKFLENCSKRY